jgi:molecular chaperone DnaK (HSP70)
MNTAIRALQMALAAADYDDYAVGIDLGTTKSCLATAGNDGDEIYCEASPIHEEGQPEGEIAMPSVVALTEDRVVVGHAARRLARRKGYANGYRSFSETKNEMGLRCHYPMAPKGFRTATDIACVLIDQLVVGSCIGDRPNAAHWVIAVPASFHGAQRRATLDAALSTELMDEDSLSLIDEPYAALLDLLFRRPDALDRLKRGGACLVFDFGGGTCDVAVFDLADGGEVLAPRLRATSRYHRIGGGDIDRAIVHGHLLPTLLERYGLDRSEVSFRDKRDLFEPVLRGVAEQLKLTLCRRLRSALAAGRDDPDLEVVAAGDYCVEWNGRQLWCSDPVLSRATFEKLLAPFVDPNPGTARSDEYVERDSVFSPVVHALFRAGLTPDNVSVVLLNGSSSLIPQLQQALRSYFPASELVEIGDAGDMQAAVARGAALQALSLAATGKPLIAPVCSSDIALRTRQGMVSLLSAGSRLPAASRNAIPLRAPESREELPLDLSIEVLADAGKRVVGKSVWQLAAPIEAGEPLALHWEMDSNQCLSLRIERQRAEAMEPPFEQRFDAPITHVDQQHTARCRMLEAEEAVRAGNIPPEALTETFAQMARDADSIGQTERALHFISCAIQHGKPTYYLLNLRAMFLESLGDYKRAEQVYRQASEWSTARFNLALFLHRRGRNQEALEQIDRVLAETDTAAYMVLKADIIAALGNAEGSRLYYQDAVSRIDNPREQSRWALGWLARGARVLGKAELVQRFNAARDSQLEAEEDSMLNGAMLPDAGGVEHGRG